MVNKKIKIYGWVSIPDGNEVEIRNRVIYYKNKGIDGIICITSLGLDMHRRFGSIVKKVGLEYHAWLPTLAMSDNLNLTSKYFAVNGLNESSYDKPPYVSNYKFLCPSNPEVFNSISESFSEIAKLPEIDGIHLDYIRFPDLILPSALWKKYGLDMTKESLKYDYCYCKKCQASFKNIHGIEIKKVNNPFKLEEWRQFRCNLITNFVNRLATIVKSKNKLISAAVFPGSFRAKNTVRQDWGNWKVDALFLMNYSDFYNEDVDWIGKMCKNAVELIDNKTTSIYSGLQICNNPQDKLRNSDPESHGISADQLKDAIDESVENGANGICLFMLKSMKEEHFKVLKKSMSLLS